MDPQQDFDFDHLTVNSTSPDPSPTKLKRLKKKTTTTTTVTTAVADSFSPPSPNSDDERRPLEPEEDSDGLDPLFSETVKRVLEFSPPEEFDADDHFSDNGDDPRPPSPGGAEPGELEKISKKRKKSGGGGGGDGNGKSASKAKAAKRKEKEESTAKRKEKEERKAYLAQQADFQRVMRERKCVGFKPVPMVEKPISSVLEKIRRRKMELTQKARSMKASAVDSDNDNDDDDDSSVDLNSFMDTSKFEQPVSDACVDKPRSREDRIQTPIKNISLEEPEKTFRPPVDDTQDLFPDLQTNDSQDPPSNEEPDSPVEDVSPTLPSLNLELDSALPDEISSDEEESDKENNDPFLHPLRKEKSSAATGDPVKEFLDEEALEDDSDNDLNFEDRDEENEAEMEDLCDYIATDFKEKTVDQDRRNELHQKWLQQQDEAGTENLIQKLKYGVKQQEPSFLQDENDDRDEDGDGSESDSEDSGDDNPASNPRLTKKQLRQMIPQMFTDKDDGYVSSEDIETERSLSRQFFLQKKGLKQQSKFVTAAEDDKSKEVFGRIKKVNVVPQTSKKAKTSSFFDVLPSKGSTSDSSKSSFLRRASSHPLPSSNRQGSSTGRSFIFGRDDSRSSAPIIEETNEPNQSGSLTKKTATAKFTGSQVKWSTQQTQTRGDKAAGTSLFEILKRSSMQTGNGNREDVDHQAVFAAFKTVKKQIKVVGRS